MASFHEDGKAVEGALASYRRLLFPGVEDPKDSFVERAKKQLAEEAKRVYMVTPHGKGAQETLQRALQSKNPDIQSWASHEVHKENVAKARLHGRLSRGSKELPKGTEKF